MKKVLIIGFMFANIKTFAIPNATMDSCPLRLSKAEKLFDSTVINQILALTLGNYIGKLVDSLLNKLPLGFLQRGFMPLKLGYAKGVYQIYGESDTNGCSIQIYVDFQHPTFRNLNPNYNWDMELAKKENIAYIRVIRNDIVCEYGCAYTNYY